MIARERNTKIPKGMEQLFKEDIHMQYRQGRAYQFVSLEEKPTQIILESDERLLEARCPVEGCFIKRKDARYEHESTVQECPCCGYDPRTSLDFFIGTLRRETKQGQNIQKNLTILKLLANPENQVKKANLQNSFYPN